MSVFAALQIIAHLLTFGAVALWYHDPLARYKPLESILATLLAGPSLAAAIWVWLSGDRAGPFELLLIITLCGLVLRAGGNVALLLPPRRASV